MNLSTHFTLDELTQSETATRLGIDNSPSDEVVDNLYTTAAGLERIRTVLDAPVLISSGYRCPKLNSAVHGSKVSQHMRGQAADFRAPKFGTPLQVCMEIVENTGFVDFDCLILEGTWVHVSFSDDPRNEVLTAHFDNGKVSYSGGLPRLV